MDDRDTNVSASFGGMLYVIKVGRSDGFLCTGLAALPPVMPLWTGSCGWGREHGYESPSWTIIQVSLCTHAVTRDILPHRPLRPLSGRPNAPIPLFGVVGLEQKASSII